MYTGIYGNLVVFLSLDGLFKMSLNARQLHGIL